jgi:hypothetical protein
MKPVLFHRHKNLLGGIFGKYANLKGTLASKKPMVEWSPAALFGAGQKGGWYDFQDVSTLYQDSAATIPVTTYLDPIGFVLDKSGNGNHLTQADNAKRPFWNSFYGIVLAEFSAVGPHFLECPAFDLTDEQMLLCAGVGKVDDLTAQIYAELTQDADTNPGGFRMIAPNIVGADNMVSIIHGSAISYAQTGATLPGPVAFVQTTHAKMSASGAFHVLRINGAFEANGTPGSGAGTFANDQLHIGARHGSILPFKGGLTRLVIRGGISDQTDIDNLEAYVSSTIGV